MRFISKFGSWAMPIKAEHVEAYATGLTRTVSEGVYAKFAPGTLTAAERELAINHWTFNGLGQLEDQVTTVPPDYRIGGFDTEIAQQMNGWDDETRVLVEEKLLARALVNDDILAIEEIRVAPPWPRYDSYAGGPKALLRKLVDEGHDIGLALAYERENQRRDDVILALEELLADPEALAELEPQPEEVLG